MSEPSNPQDNPKPQRDRNAPPPTPFDHPFFLPVLLFAGSIWFGYDGFINTDPEMLEHQTFNRWGFAILVPLMLWYGYRGLQEMREDREKKAGTPNRQD